MNPFPDQLSKILKNDDILCDPESVMFALHMTISEHRCKLIEQLKNTKVSVGETKGIITNIDSGGIRVKDTSTGKEKTIPLSKGKVRQLLAETTRK